MIEPVLAVFCIAILSGYLWLKQRHRFWESHRIPHLKSDSLLFGNFRDVFSGELSMPAKIEKLYNDLAPHKFGGIYLASKPVLAVRDPELIKRILIKDFHHFADRSFDVANKANPLSRHLVFLTGEEWHVLRHKLTPTFTSGKMKLLFVLMKDCVEKLADIVEKDHETVDVKDLMSRYTTDVISSCAFGVAANSLQDPASEFRVNGKAIFLPSLKRRVYEFLLNTCPRVISILGLSPFPKDANDFFIKVVDDMVNYRKKSGVVRNDFLNLLLQVQKEMTEEHKNFDFPIAAQCFLFFAAGFDTSSGSLSFILYELAEHPNVQEKLQEEIDHVLRSHDGKITYESLQEMPFMDKVFNETLRLFPVVPALQRICTKDYCFPDNDFIIKRGESIFIPVQGLHRDSQYFPNPDSFNPENFSEEAKHSRPSCTFLPFGDGPRNCIGMRFGIMQVKLALTTILKEYTVTVSPEMKLPVELLPNALVTASKNDILLNFNKREKYHIVAQRLTTNSSFHMFGIE